MMLKKLFNIFLFICIISSSTDPFSTPNIKKQSYDNNTSLPKSRKNHDTSSGNNGLKLIKNVLLNSQPKGFEIPEELSKLYNTVKQNATQYKYKPWPILKEDELMKYIYKNVDFKYRSIRAFGCPFVAFDCEMVYLNNGQQSLAHLTMICLDINLREIKTYSKYISQDTKNIIDYVEEISGVKEENLIPVYKKNSDNREPFDVMITSILGLAGEQDDELVYVGENTVYVGQNTVLIGHDVRNDMKVLKLYHPKIIDTSIVYGMWNKNYNDYNRIGLKTLTHLLLGKYIQVGIHNSKEDAYASLAILLYQLDKDSPMSKVKNNTDQRTSKVKNNTDPIYLHKINNQRTVVKITSSHDVINLIQQFIIKKSYEINWNVQFFTDKNNHTIKVMCDKYKYVVDLKSEFQNVMYDPKIVEDDYIFIPEFNKHLSHYYNLSFTINYEAYKIDYINKYIQKYWKDNQIYIDEEYMKNVTIMKGKYGPSYPGKKPHKQVHSQFFTSIIYYSKQNDKVILYLDQDKNEIRRRINHYVPGRNNSLDFPEEKYTLTMCPMFNPNKCTPFFYPKNDVYKQKPSQTNDENQENIIYYPNIDYQNQENMDNIDYQNQENIIYNPNIDPSQNTLMQNENEIEFVGLTYKCGTCQKGTFQKQCICIHCEYECKLRDEYEYECKLHDSNMEFYNQTSTICFPIVPFDNNYDLNNYYSNNDYIHNSVYPNDDMN